MFENFKTDIIYYNTATDFELEFNLCGCCRMRLFNNKCSDKKSLLLSLSRAVSRSRVTIITAPLFSEENIMKTVASAIGSKTEIINNAEFHIASDSEITVIKGSLPLVTEDGIFGGCIIESGPQSLIILTDNKAVRKTIMKNLLHQYIAEVSLRHDNSNEELITEDNEPDEEAFENQEAIEEADEQALILDNTEADDTEEEPETEDNLLFIETDSYNNSSSDYDSENKALYTNIDDNTALDEDGYYDDEYYTEEREAKPSAFNIWLLVISIVLLLALAVLCYCIFYVPTKAGISPSVYLTEIFDTMFK